MNFNFKENKMETLSEISNLSFVLLSVSAGIFIYGTLKTISDIQTFRIMKKNEKILTEKGLDKARMYNKEHVVFNEKTGGYETRLVKNRAWYQRLMEK